MDKEGKRVSNSQCTEICIAKVLPIRIGGAIGKISCPTLNDYGERLITALVKLYSTEYPCKSTFVVQTTAVLLHALFSTSLCTLQILVYTPGNHVSAVSVFHSCMHIENRL